MDKTEYNITIIPSTKEPYPMRNTILFLLPFLASPLAAEPLNYNVVSFSESASTIVTNDLMTATLTIREEGSDRQTVSNAVTNRLNIVNARIAANRQFKSELTNRYTQPSYNNKGKISTWHDQATLQIQSKDFAALNKLIAESQKEAAIESLQFSVSPEKRSETINQLSKEALKNFQARAKVISQTLGFSDYKIVNIHLNSNFRTYHDNMMPKAASMRAAPLAAAEAYTPEMTTDNAGSQEISQTVNGSIQM